jgi:CDP-diacylglycerol--serine O-phosphatidyltransferase
MKLFNLPNTLTLVNLFAGCIALALIFSPSGFEYVPYMTLVSLIADYFDGMAARFTNTQTGIGKELDSLADVVSFGVVPAAIFYRMLNFYFISIDTPEWQVMIYSSPAFSIALFSALRLAKFNLDERQSEGFIGLATPACTIFVVGLQLVFIGNQFNLAHTLLNSYLIISTSVVLSYLLIAEIPMFSFKFKSFGWAGNEIRYVFIIVSVGLLAAFKFAGISLAIVLYVLGSIGLMMYKSGGEKNISNK